jgi:hypothetical protein
VTRARGANRREEVLLAERLDEIPEDAGLRRTLHELVLPVGGEHHDRDRALVEDSPGGLDPVELRHLDVQKGQVRALGAGQEDGFFAVAGLGADLETGVLEQGPEVEPDDRLVFGDQDPQLWVSLAENAQPRDSGRGAPERFLKCGPMSDHEYSTPKPLVLRVEISAEQAASLAPLLGAATEHVGIRPVSDVPVISDAAADSRVTELKRLETDLDQREAEFEADVQFREDRIERWRTELEELEQTLERRERDLVSYVDQLQGVMSGSDNAAWWSRPVGGDGGVR